MELIFMFIFVGVLIGALIGYTYAERNQITPGHVSNVINKFKFNTNGNLTTDTYNQLLDAIAFEITHID